MKPLFMRYICHSSLGVLKAPLPFVASNRGAIPPFLVSKCDYSGKTTDAKCKGCKHRDGVEYEHV